jgi:hypothetical protein
MTGFTGIYGTDGDSGLFGATGMTGRQGPTGILMTGYTGIGGIIGYIGYTGTPGFTGVPGSYMITGFTGISGLTGYTGYYSTGFTGFVGYTGSDEYPVRNIPTIVSFDDDMTYTRQMLSRQMQENAYITDGTLDILARTRGYTQNETVYTFGKSRPTTYMATVAVDSSYGTVVSSNFKNWSPLQNASANPSNRVIWDGTKWIVTRKDAQTVLYSYGAETFTAIDASLSSIATNSRLYVGIGISGMFYSYDGIHWNNGSSGASLLSSSPGSAVQIGKVVWNGKMWVAVGNGALYAIIYSYDGINWTGVTNSKTLFDIAGGALDLAWNGTIWVATGANSTGKLVAISYDGINWSNSGGLSL